MEREVFEPGIYSISNERYHAAEGLSRTALWTFKQLPYKYWYEYLSGGHKAPSESEAFLIGNLVHCLVLEPDLFKERYFVMPKVNRTTKQGKINYQEYLLKASARTLINQDQYQLAELMRQSVYNNCTSIEILHGAKKEQSIFWLDEQTGIMCKARPDIWNHPIMGDLKTTLDAGYRGFQSAAFKDGYFLQAGMQYEAAKAIGEPFEKYVYLCVEKKAPYSTGIYMLDDEALQFGIDLFHKILGQYKACQESGEWPDYGVQMLMIPKYATMELSNE